MSPRFWNFFSLKTVGQKTALRARMDDDGAAQGQVQVGISAEMHPHRRCARVALDATHATSACTQYLLCSKGCCARHPHGPPVPFSAARGSVALWATAVSCATEYMPHILSAHYAGSECLGVSGGLPCRVHCLGLGCCRSRGCHPAAGQAAAVWHLFRALIESRPVTTPPLRSLASPAASAGAGEHLHHETSRA